MKQPTPIQQTCKQCVYFKKLVKTKESFGECTWWEHYENPETPWMPDWSISITNRSSALSPNRKACDVFDGGEE
jgi:hypothetical protein